MRDDLICIARNYLPVLEATNADICEVFIQGAGDEDDEIRVSLTLVKSDDDWVLTAKRYDAVGELINELDLGWFRPKTIFRHDTEIKEGETQ